MYTSGQKFFEKAGSYAVDSTAGTGLLPSVALAQAALESGFGKSELSSKYHNYFGIKAAPGEPAVVMNTGEVINGKRVTIKDRFRIFSSPADAFAKRVQFLKKNKRYKTVFDAKTPAAQAAALQRAGYATAPDYALRLTSLIKSYGLEEYDRLAKKKERSESLSQLSA